MSLGIALFFARNMTTFADRAKFLAWSGDQREQGKPRKEGVYLPPPTIAYANITAGAKPQPYDEIRKHCLPPPGRGTEGVGFCNTNITAGVKPQPYGILRDSKSREWCKTVPLNQEK